MKLDLEIRYKYSNYIKNQNRPKRNLLNVLITLVYSK